MQFYEFTDYYHNINKLHKGLYKDSDTFYDEMYHTSMRRNDVFAFRQSLLESDWIANNRPYYNIYPAITPLVDKLSLDLPCSAISVPPSTLCLRLPIGDNNPYKAGDSDVRTVLFGIQKTRSCMQSEELIDGLVILFDTGERGELDSPIYVFKIFPLRPEMSIQEATKTLPHHRSFKYGIPIEDSVVEAITKLCLTVCLIGQNPDLVTPDVLSKDRTEYTSANPDRKQFLQERAQRKGKNGYNIGLGLESCPHYRRSHLATIRVGKGRSSYKVIIRKGSIVHREKIINIPSGYDQ